jgi:hypothetical protein
LFNARCKTSAVTTIQGCEPQDFQNRNSGTPVAHSLKSNVFERRQSMTFKKVAISVLPLACFLFTAPAAFAHDEGGHAGEHEELNEEHQAEHQDLNAQHNDVHEELQEEHNAAHQYEMTPWEHRRLHERLNREHARSHENLEEEHEAQHENLEAQHQQYHYYRPNRWWGRRFLWNPYE